MNIGWITKKRNEGVYYDKISYINKNDSLRYDYYCIFLCFTIFEWIGVMKLFRGDLPIITINDSLFFLVITSLIVFLVLMIWPNRILLSIVRQYRIRILLVIFSVEIICFYKCVNERDFVLFAIAFMILYFLIDYEAYKTILYFEKESPENDSSYVEKPVVGRTNLTRNQIIALDMLRKIIDKRESTDSFNIGLIGAWGCGKTSITNSLIYEYEHEKDKKYFIFRINALSLRESKNIVSYIKNYFEDLFREYGVGLATNSVLF